MDLQDTSLSLDDFERIEQLLKNANFHKIEYTNNSLTFEDPSCVARSFQTFMEYAWVFVCIITAMLIFGWAVSLIRGAKNNIFINARNLIVIFGALAAAGPIINTIWGEDVFTKGCKQMIISASELDTAWKLRNEILEAQGIEDLYEEIIITIDGQEITTEIDNGIFQDIPEMPAPDEPIQTKTDGAVYATDKDHKPNVLYTMQNRDQFLRIQGSRTWRNTNPGGLRFSSFARQNGAIGEAEGLAVFPDENTGMDALLTLLRTDYKNKTLEETIKIFSGDNTSDMYRKKIQDAVGVKYETKISELDSYTLKTLAKEIKTILGWREGGIIPAQDEDEE